MSDQPELLDDAEVATDAGVVVRYNRAEFNRHLMRRRAVTEGRKAALASLVPVEHVVSLLVSQDRLEHLVKTCPAWSSEPATELRVVLGEQLVRASMKRND